MHLVFFARSSFVDRRKYMHSSVVKRCMQLLGAIKGFEESQSRELRGVRRSNWRAPSLDEDDHVLFFFNENGACGLVRVVAAQKSPPCSSKDGRGCCLDLGKLRELWFIATHETAHICLCRVQGHLSRVLLFALLVAHMQLASSG